MNYMIEDELATIYHDGFERMGGVDHPHRQVHHPYPHPKALGLNRDHRKR